MAFKMKGPMFFRSAMKHYSSHKEYMTHDPSEGPMSDKRHRHPDKPSEFPKKEGSGVNYGSPAKNRVTEGGKLVDHTHKDGSKHTYEAPKTRKDGTIAPGGTDEKGTITPPAPKMKYDKKGGPKMKDKNPAPKMNYDKKKK